MPIREGRRESTNALAGVEDPTSADVDDWQIARAAAVDLAIERHDIASLRRWGVEPGGFGNAAIRQKAWSYLLRSSPNLDTTKEEDIRPSTAPADQNVDHEVGGGRALDTNGKNAAEFHPDEGQVLLDTKRSFVYYPENISPREKLRLQGELNDLIVTLLRRRKGLSYFQGYHDIISVLYLTFFPYRSEEPLRRRSISQRRPRSRKTSHNSAADSAGSSNGRRGSVDRTRDAGHATVSPIISSLGTEAEMEHLGRDTPPLQLSSSGRSNPSPDEPDTPTRRKQETEQWRKLLDCCDELSLLKIRDAMGHTLSPSIGYLRLFKRILKAADPVVSKLVLGVSPTPFFALSWLLTIFSHDLNVLEPTQRIFDFFLPRNPAIMIYLGVAIIMLKREKLLELKDTLESDPGILHSYLSRLPPLIADNPAGQEEIISMKDDRHPGGSASTGTYLEADGPNPLEAVRMSELFTLTDTLWARFPLDHSAVRAQEILAPRSVILTDDGLGSVMSLEEAAAFVGEKGFAEEDVVVTPPMPDTDEEPEQKEPFRDRKGSRFSLGFRLRPTTDAPADTSTSTADVVDPTEEELALFISGSALQSLRALHSSALLTQEMQDELEGILSSCGTGTAVPFSEDEILEQDGKCLVPRRFLVELADWARSDGACSKLHSVSLLPSDYSLVALQAGSRTATSAAQDRLIASNPYLSTPFLPSSSQPFSSKSRQSSARSNTTFSFSSIGSDIRNASRELSAIANILFSIVGVAGGVWWVARNSSGMSNEKATLLAFLSAFVVGFAEVWLYISHSNALEKERQLGVEAYMANMRRDLQATPKEAHAHADGTAGHVIVARAEAAVDEQGTAGLEQVAEPDSRAVLGTAREQPRGIRLRRKALPGGADGAGIAGTYGQ